MTGAPSFDDRITLGTVITILSNFGLATAFLFKKFYRSEEDTKRIDEHEKLLDKLAEVSGKNDIGRVQQQTLIEQMDRRIVNLEKEWGEWRRDLAVERRRNNDH